MSGRYRKNRFFAIVARLEDARSVQTVRRRVGAADYVNAAAGRFFESLLFRDQLCGNRLVRFVMMFEHTGLALEPAVSGWLIAQHKVVRFDFCFRPGEGLRLPSFGATSARADKGVGD